MIEMIHKLIGKIWSTEEILKDWNMALCTKRMIKKNVTTRGVLP